jgi:alpha-beta hydrolase superfamily lysophospholipase
MTVTRVMSRVMPTITMRMHLCKRWICRDYAVAETDSGDPLSHRKATARMDTEFESAIAWTQARAGEFAVPLLIMQRSENGIADSSGSREFFSKVRIEDKEYIQYSNAHREVDDKLSKDEILDDLTGWMDRHLQSEALRNKHNLACVA